MIHVGEAACFTTNAAGSSLAVYAIIVQQQQKHLLTLQRSCMILLHPQQSRAVCHLTANDALWFWRRKDFGTIMGSVLLLSPPTYMHKVCVFADAEVGRSEDCDAKRDATYGD